MQVILAHIYTELKGKRKDLVGRMQQKQCLEGNVSINFLYYKIRGIPNAHFT